MIWAKTDAGRTEIQVRALVKERARRNLLLLIDGVKSEEMLLAALAGIDAEDFRKLQALKLIVPAAPMARPAEVAAPLPSIVNASAMPAAAAAASLSAGLPSSSAPASSSTPAAASAAAPAALPDHVAFTATLTRLISVHLGLRGFVLALGAEKATTIEELQAVARRALEQIRERKGDAVAAAARQTLYGD